MVQLTILNFNHGFDAALIQTCKLEKDSFKNFSGESDRYTLFWEATKRLKTKW